MKRLFLLFTIVFLTSCKTEPFSLYEEVCQIAGLDGIGQPVLMQYGEEKGFLEPMASYGIFTVDSVDYEKLHNSIIKNKKFEAGDYYYNIELDDYLLLNKLEILNMNKSLFYENKHAYTYHLYLLSDKKSFAICKVRH